MSGFLANVTSAVKGFVTVPTDVSQESENASPSITAVTTNSEESVGKSADQNSKEQSAAGLSDENSGKGSGNFAVKMFARVNGLLSPKSDAKETIPLKSPDLEAGQTDVEATSDKDNSSSTAKESGGFLSSIFGSSNQGNSQASDTTSNISSSWLNPLSILKTREPNMYVLNS
jgi:hypothetical protein